jgi:DNA polymerase III alpha subunit
MTEFIYSTVTAASTTAATVQAQENWSNEKYADKENDLNEKYLQDEDTENDSEYAEQIDGLNRHCCKDD